MKRVLAAGHSMALLAGAIAISGGAAVADDVIRGEPEPGSAKLRPTPRYQPKAPATAYDVERLRRAEMKRARKAALRASCRSLNGE